MTNTWNKIVLMMLEWTKYDDKKSEVHSRREKAGKERVWKCIGKTISKRGNPME